VVVGQFPVTAASSDGRRNTIQRVDSIMFPGRTALFDGTW